MLREAAGIEFDGMFTLAFRTGRTCSRAGQATRSGSRPW
jgi:hypothetical protein